jgi:hypothetical protein
MLFLEDDFNVGDPAKSARFSRINADAEVSVGRETHGHCEWRVENAFPNRSGFGQLADRIGNHRRPFGCGEPNDGRGDEERNGGLHQQQSTARRAGEMPRRRAA